MNARRPRDIGSAAVQVDGNKRLGWFATRAFCELNGYDFQIGDIDAAEQFVLDVAAGVLHVEAAAPVVAEHLRPRT